jgi:cyanophycinase-like exopeptidase
MLRPTALPHSAGTIAPMCRIPPYRVAASLVVLLGVSRVALTDGPGYQHYLIGDPADVVRPTSGLIVLQGGGDDVDQNYVRMGAHGGGGDFVVLRASGEDDYNEYIYSLCHCDSVETIVFYGREAASDPYVIRTIRNAEALFIAGGDQSRYVRFWKASPVEEAINFVAAKPAPVGGTSAGMAILGEFAYSAMAGESLTSAAALADPFAPDLTLERDFISLLPLRNVLTDQHLWERDRIGRTVALLARLVNDGWTPTARAIAAERQTAVHIDPRNGRAEIFATPEHPTPYAYFLRTTRPPDRCVPGRPLLIRDVAVYRVAPGGEFDLRSWSGRNGIRYTLSASEGVLRSSRGGIY